MISVPYEVKKALRDGMLRKNYRFVVLNDDETEDFTIDNDTLVSESVNIDERMCSGDTIQFGLCEGTSLEFQYFNHENIYGRRLHVFVDVEYDPAEDFYPIPMGFFDVAKCSRQASTGIMKVTAYNKLQSDYLDAKANYLILELFDNPDYPVAFYDIRNILLDNYEIEKKDYDEVEITRSTISYITSRRLSGGSISLKAKYGIDSPLNYYEFRQGNTGSTTGYLHVAASESEGTLDASSAYTVQTPYDLEQMEQWYYDKISDLMSEAFSVSSGYMSRFINPQTSSGTFYKSYLGWHNFFGVCLEKSNGTKIWYSTIAYRAGLSGVVGTLKDFIHSTITDCVKIYFYIPCTLQFWGNNTDAMPTYEAIYRFYCPDGSGSEPPSQDGKWTYNYYDNSAMTHAIAGSYVFKDYLGEPRNLAWTVNGWNNTYRYTDITQADLISVIPSELPDITLREAASSVYELNCQFGQLSRETDLFFGVELNYGGLYPAEDLYPNDSLYPQGSPISATRAMYSQLWADEGNVRKWRNLVITYKGLDGEGNEADIIHERVIDADGTDDYNMSDNWLFRNLIWTEEQIDDYADAMIAKMQNITWFPFEMWCAGLPYLETGDEIEIPLNGTSYTSYVLQRQLKGIQNLQDTYINGTLDIF